MAPAPKPPAPGASKRTPRTPKKARARRPPLWPAKFLAALEDTHLVTEACKQARVARSTAYKHRAEDEQFAAAWSEVEEASTERLEEIAVKRASEGSDLLLIFLLKARRPDTYREHHKHEHTGPEGGPIAAEIVAVDAREHADATREFLARIAGPSA